MVEYSLSNMPHITIEPRSVSIPTPLCQIWQHYYTHNPSVDFPWGTTELLDIDDSYIVIIHLHIKHCVHSRCDIGGGGTNTAKSLRTKQFQECVWKHLARVNSEVSNTACWNGVISQVMNHKAAYHRDPWKMFNIHKIWQISTFETKQFQTRV